MCSGNDPAGTAAPRPAPGPAVDPISLEPVDEVVVTTLVDNVFDGLLDGGQAVVRAPLTSGMVAAPVRERPDHHRPARRARVLRAGHRAPRIDHHHAVVRHRHLARRHDRQRRSARDRPARGAGPGPQSRPLRPHRWAGHAGRPHALPITVHPLAWTRRRLAIPGAEAVELPTLSRRALESEGCEVIERRQPSLLVDGWVLITGEVDRTTDFERGMPPSHQAWDDEVPGGAGWRHDPLVLDDQALVAHVRGRGLVVLTGCGHAGPINIVRHAMRLTGVDRLHALLGGLHLSGAAFAPLVA